MDVANQLTQLEAARQLVLADSVLYPQIVQGILPIVGANARLELRRWGAEFLAETFASPTVSVQQKESLSIVVLQTLRELLEMPDGDTGVVKSVVQVAASIYGLVFRYILLARKTFVKALPTNDQTNGILCYISTRITNPHDTQTWERMAAIKSNVLKRWDTAVTGIRVCCIKFVQRVVQVQTPGVIADPRRPEQSEISLALVPRDHPLIPPPRLEPEASGLLDRLLNVFFEQPSNPLLVNATLNCLGVLIRTRQTISNKIISAILNFNPLKQVNSPMNAKIKVQVKSMERTTRALLVNILRRNADSPFAPRIKQHIDRLMQSRLELFDEGSRKRALPTEPRDGLDNAKRQRLGADLPAASSIPPLPPGPTSSAQLFTLTSDVGLSSFDVTQLPIDLVVRITLPVLHSINQEALDNAINGVRSRYLSLQKAATHNSSPNLTLDDEEDDYEPDFQPTEDIEQKINSMDALPPEDPLEAPAEVALGPFKLPPPPPLTAEETEQIGKGTISRVFSMMNILDEPSLAKRKKPGLNRLAGSNYDREAWITVITRLATRASAGLEGDQSTEEGSKTALQKPAAELSLSDGIRETLFKYIIEDFRTRIPIAISWLNEEWFNDRMQMQAWEQQKRKASPPPKQHYERWVLKVLDGIVPYLDAKDKVLIRFLSEIQGVDEKILERVKGLARDPERVTLAVNAIHYLILLRPPVREMCIDAIEDLWRKNDDAKAPARKLLTKWRPQVLPESKAVVAPAMTNGTQQQQPPDSGRDPSASVSQGGVSDGQAQGVEERKGSMPVAAAG